MAVRSNLMLVAQAFSCGIVIGPASLAHAQTHQEPAQGNGPPVETPPASPFLYSVPWQLRALPAPTVARIDGMFGFDEDKESRSGTTFVSSLGAIVRIPGTGPARAGLALTLRALLVGDSPPAHDGTWLVSNPVMGAAYALRLPEDLLLNVFLGITLPVGGGGGDDPDPRASLARSRAAALRWGFDNPAFGVNDFSFIPGIGFGWVAHGWTLQVEATLSHGIRVRGEHAQQESTKTNSGIGLHVGKFVASFLSLNGELRYQRWLNPPFAVEIEPTDAAMDIVSFAVGPRFHLQIPGGWLRPGLAYVRSLDKPLAAASPNLHAVQIDVPMFF